VATDYLNQRTAVLSAKLYEADRFLNGKRAPFDQMIDALQQWKDEKGLERLRF